MPDVRLIDANAIVEKLKSYYEALSPDVQSELIRRDEVSSCIAELINAPTIDAQPVNRCKDCMYFKPAHVKCPDGSEKDYSEFPPEAFEPNFNLGVTTAYGINIGSQCLYDEWCGAYVDDKTVFRKEDDFCSRFKAAKYHGAKMEGDS